MEIIRKVEQVGSTNGNPDGFVKIVDCGETSDSKVRDVVGAQKGNIEIPIQTHRAMSYFSCLTVSSFI